MLQQYLDTTKGRTLPNPRAALQVMKEQDANSLIIVAPGRKDGTTLEQAVKSRDDLASYLAKQAHLGADSPLSLIWTYSGGDDSIRIDFVYRELEWGSAAATIRKGVAVFTYKRAPFDPIKMEGVVMPHHRLRRPDHAVDVCSELLLGSCDQVA